MFSATQNHYPMTADVDTDYGNANHENICGLTMDHAFAILAAFQLKD